MTLPSEEEEPLLMRVVAAAIAMAVVMTIYLILSLNQQMKTTDTAEQARQKHTREVFEANCFVGYSLPMVETYVS